MASSKKRKDIPKPVPQADRIIAREPDTIVCLGIIVLLVIVFFREILFGNAYLWEDFLYQNYPFRNFAATTMAAGEIPLWNPFTFNGMPFLADIQTAVFYLPLTALVFFARDGSLNFYWLEAVILLHYILAGVSMFYLARSYDLKQIPSLFSSIAYMLCGFMVVHAIHQQMITMVAWYPLILLLFRRVMQSSEWKWVFAAALVLGHSILAGYPQLSLYLYFFLFCYVVFEIFTMFGLRNLISKPAAMVAGRASSVIVLSVALAMIQLLPTFELAGLSQRAQITYEKAAEGSLAWSQLLTLWFPKLFGSAGADGYNYWGPGTYWYYWETCIYLGILPFLLALLTIGNVKRDKHLAFFWGVMLFSVLYALGDGFLLHKLFYEVVPGFSKFRNPARVGIFMAFSSALLSGFALQRLLYGEHNENETRVKRKILLGAAGTGILLWVLIVAGPLVSAPNPQLLAVARSEAHMSVVILIASAAVIWFVMQGRISHMLALILLLAVFLVDMTKFGGNQNNGKTNPANYFKRASQLVNPLKEEGKAEIFRVNTRNSQGMVMDRNQGMIDRIFMMEGYTPLALQRVYAPLATSDQSFDLLNVKYKTVTAEDGRHLSLQPHPSYMARAFFLYQLHVVRSEDELLSYLKSPAFDHRTTAVLEKEPAFDLSQPDSPPVWHTAITSYRNNAIALEVETSHDGLLVLSEIYYPGWKAYLNGQSADVYCVDYNLRGIFVPKGKHSVRMAFEPESYARGKAITLVSLLLCIGGITVARLRERTSRI
jgi:hypothetical protein